MLLADAGAFDKPPLEQLDAIEGYEGDNEYYREHRDQLAFAHTCSIAENVDAQCHLPLMSHFVRKGDIGSVIKLTEVWSNADRIRESRTPEQAADPILFFQ